MHQDAPEIERLRAWMAALESRVAELNESVRPLLAEIEKTKQQLDLVHRLLKLEAGNGAPAQVSAASSDPSRGFGKTAGEGSVPDALAVLLQEAGRPLHISQIKERFLNTGRTIPGRGTETNLISYMVRDGRFVRVAKGTYTFAPLGGTRRLQHRRRRRRRSRRRAAGRAVMQQE
jgi:hypothetical protein